MSSYIIHPRSEEHTCELQSHVNLVCRLLLEKKKSREQRPPCYPSGRGEIRVRERTRRGALPPRWRLTSQCTVSAALCPCLKRLFFFKSAAPPETSTLPLPDALPI